MKTTILITGGSGAVGQDLIQTWATRDDVNVVLLIHNNVPAGLQTSGANIQFVWGDITQRELGLNQSILRHLRSSVTHILHSAANTRFDSSWEEAYDDNICGTLNTLEFAGSCPNLRHFGQVSTAFVSGKREGVIKEDELEHEAGFTNSYERSKNRAERMALVAGADFPVSVLRLSVVFGDSQTGAVSSIQAAHQTIRMLYLTGAPFMPGHPDYLLDFIPSDIVSRTISKLFLDQCEPGTYHITAGPEKCFRLEEFFEEVYRVYGRLDPDWGRRGFEPPQVVSSKLLFEDKSLISDRRHDALALTRHFAAQLDHPKVYDQTNLGKSIPEYQAEMPHCREYLPKVIDYLMRTNWCRKAA